MALDFPDPNDQNPWYDGEMWWRNDGDGWLQVTEGVPAGGVTGYKNVIINPNFRVNQRGFDGDWDSWPNSYGYDRWVKSSLYPGKICQPVEDLNLVEGQKYTFSWAGGGDGIITYGSGSAIRSGPSPLVFTYNLVLGEPPYFYIPYATGSGAQVEMGGVQTALEVRSIGLEYHLCFRYYFLLASTRGSGAYRSGLSYASGSMDADSGLFPAIMRINPNRIIITPPNYTGCSAFSVVAGNTNYGFRVTSDANARFRASGSVIGFDAEM